MNDDGRENNSLKYYGVSMLRHRCDASIYPQLYYQIDKQFKMLPHPYVNSFYINSSKTLLKE